MDHDPRQAVVLDRDWPIERGENREPAADGVTMFAPQHRELSAVQSMPRVTSSRRQRRPRTSSRARIAERRATLLSMTARLRS